MTLPAFVVLAIILCCTMASGAGNSAVAFVANQKTDNWERYTSDGEEFSALFPNAPTVAAAFRPPQMFETQRRGTLYATYDDGTGFVMLSFDNAKHQENLGVFIAEFQQYGVFNAGATFEREIALDGFRGKQYRVKSETTPVNGIVQFYRTKNHIYIFEAVGDERSQPAIERFLKSVTLKPKAGAKDIASVQANRSAAPPPTLPDAGKIQPPAPREMAYSPREVARKAVMVTRPEPQYTETARHNSVSGTVVLRAVLSSTGRVTGIRAVTGLPDGLTDKAIEAARLLTFIPAMKDGRFVSQYIQIEYNFNLY